MYVSMWRLVSGQSQAPFLRSNSLCVLGQSLLLGPGLVHQSGWVSWPVNSGDLLSLPPSAGVTNTYHYSYLF